MCDPLFEFKKNSSIEHSTENVILCKYFSGVCKFYAFEVSAAFKANYCSKLSFFIVQHENLSPEPILSFGDVSWTKSQYLIP